MVKQLIHKIAITLVVSGIIVVVTLSILNFDIAKTCRSLGAAIAKTWLVRWVW